uniref:U7 snRNA-associated Sm-like protein LSm11 n=2 Tax=Ciona intestinalis TaxID=7719 RepID=F6ZR96_CIOIN
MLQLMMQQKKNQRPELIDKTEKMKETRKEKTLSTIFTSMEKLSEGPFSVLHRITNDRARCKVFTRNFCGLRGVLCGYVVAYDRFMNMVMVDVDETFCKSPLGGVAQHQQRMSTFKLNSAVKDISLYGVKGSATSIGINEVPRHTVAQGGQPPLFHRHLTNLYVRGDSVILISI